jgi:hypothetical protein
MLNAQNSTIHITTSIKFLISHLLEDGNKAIVMLLNAKLNKVSTRCQQVFCAKFAQHSSQGVVTITNTIRSVTLAWFFHVLKS